MTIEEAIKKGTITLKVNGITEPKLKTRLLMQYVLNQSRQYLMVYDKKTLTQEQSAQFLKAIDKIEKGVPLQHITHQQEFMKLMFFVNEDVLIPRPDTEILVEEVIKIAKQKSEVKILDMCTGSGAISVSLAKYLPKAQITAVDISSKAIKVAKYNAKNNQVENQITFIESNLFENIPEEKYDIIVSNPPYIRKKELEKLDQEVKKEPVIALDGGEDGLTFYREITKQGSNYLKFGGHLCFEIGYDQKEEVMNLVKREEYENPYSKQDLCGNDRIVVAKRR